MATGMRPAAEKLFDTFGRSGNRTIVRMKRIVVTPRRAARLATAGLCGVLLAACNTVVPTAPGATPPPLPGPAAPAGSTEPITIEHTSLRSRTSVYESALKACKQRGHDQAIFRSQVNEDPQRPPATGPQLSTFTCR